MPAQRSIPVRLGHFFFRYRNWLFILFYAALLLPSRPIFPSTVFGSCYYGWAIATGFVITVSGQGIRALTIGLAYIVRGGKDGRPYADGLVTTGVFRHCRNPLYVGNLLMLLGVGIMANSLCYVTLMLPLFVLIYHWIVLAEENFLRQKFGNVFELYTRDTPRWTFRMNGLPATWRSMRFNWQRWLLKEQTTLWIWTSGMIAVVLWQYPQLGGGSVAMRNRLAIMLLGITTALFLLLVYVKKTGRLREPAA